MESYEKHGFVRINIPVGAGKVRGTVGYINDMKVLYLENSDDNNEALCEIVGASTVFRYTVTAQDQDGNVAVAVGDSIYESSGTYDKTSTASTYHVGYALQTVDSGESKIIDIAVVPVYISRLLNLTDVSGTPSDQDVPTWIASNGDFEFYRPFELPITQAVYIGDGTNQVKIDTDGTLTLEGTATVWDDFRVAVNNVKLGGSKIPTFTAYRGGLVLAFADQAIAGNEEIAYFNVQLPHKRKDGSDIIAHVHWLGQDGTAGNVVWKLTYSWANIDGTFPVETTTTVTAANQSANIHHYNDFPTLDGTGKTASSMLICSISRNSSNAADTYNGKSAYLLEIDFHYEIDKLGEATTP